MHRYNLLPVLLIGWTSVNVAAQVANAGPDTLICDGAMSMQGSPIPLGGSGLWALIAGCGTIVDPTAPGTTVYLCPGLNTLVWEVNDGVATTSDTVEVGVSDLPTIPAAGPDQNITGPPFSTQLMGNQPIFPSYCLWTVVTGGSVITNPNDPNAGVSGLSIGSNIFRWTCYTGPCVFGDEVAINAFVWTGIGSPSAAPAALFDLDPRGELIRLNTSANVQGLVISDVQGRAVPQHPAGSDHTWSAAHYAPGIYVFHAMINGVTCTQRFVVSR